MHYRPNLSKNIRYGLVIACFASWGPFYRAILDKLWMVSEGLPSIGYWAQFQTLSDLISAPVSAGIGVGLTILAGQTSPASEKALLIAGGLLGLLITFPLLLIVLFLNREIGQYIELKSLHHHNLVLAALGGWLGTLTIQISAFFLGKKEHLKALLIIIASNLPILVTLYVGTALHINGLMEKTLIAAVICGLAVAIWFIFFVQQTICRSPSSKTQFKKAFHQLSNFIVVGFTIGIMTPLSMMIARSTIANHLDWNSVGISTALWRISDWILCIAQAVLFYHFLPLLCRLGRYELIPHIKKLLFQVFIPALIAFFILFISRNNIFSYLYSDQLQINWQVCLLFWVGDIFRVLAIIFLLALYLLKKTSSISFVELFSQPLLALLLILGAANSLMGVGAAHIFTYGLYSLLCIYFTLYSKSFFRKNKPL